MRVVPLWINGQAAPLVPERIYEIVNAVENKVVHHAQGADVEEAKSACDAAAAVYPSWSKTLYWERRNILLKAADLIESRAVELGRAHQSSGRRLPNSTQNLLGTIPLVYDGEIRVFVHKEAIGPVLLIPPWNSPSILGPRCMAAALAAGCTIVLKASELCPLVYRKLVDVFEAAGVPKGVINQVQVRREDAAAVTDALIAHPAIRKVEFIGSTKLGKVIGQLASKYLKPLLMELGGKSTVLVLKDADLEMAAKNFAFGVFCHNGQICFSTERIIVIREIADKFIRALKEKVATNYADDLGSAATKSFALQSQAIVQAAKNDEAEFVIGNNSLIGPNKTTLTPTILQNVKRTSELADEEAFGPSASLYLADDVDTAVDMANDRLYGLTAAVWTNDAMLAMDLSSRLQYGIIHINACTLADVPMMPVQGCKSSGWGSNNASYGINDFLETKTVTMRPAASKIQFRG
ncbi:ALDH-like protein [Aspergillus phoenicis ATCC 13157]|uniref:ALDH-like protein n=1 Tax=Aspergillus phoenicis ATCC 13157 TaxID=1353007 RepID=A0A370P885_ASPPH|nr:ALDH-like protein [Aspergillus phoenicis ATCC 13157]